MHILEPKRPYIGIADFMNNQEVEHMLDVFRKYRVEGSLRRLQVGVRMSFETLYNHQADSTEAFPQKDTIGQIFYPVGCEGVPPELCQQMNEDLMFTLQYTDHQNFPDVVKNLTDALAYTGPFVDALQLDMIWPNPDKVKEVVKAFNKDIEVILQIGKDAMTDAQDDPVEVVDRLQFYQGVISHVLLDSEEVDMNANKLLPFVRAIRYVYPNLGLVIAGELAPETSYFARPFFAEFSGISIAARSRFKSGESTFDPFAWDRASQYLTEALCVSR